MPAQTNAADFKEVLTGITLGVGQVDLETGSFVHFAYSPDKAIMILYNFFANGKANACSFLVPVMNALKQLEYFIGIGLFKSGAIIFKNDAVIFIALFEKTGFNVFAVKQRTFNFYCGLQVVLFIFYGVGDQVFEQLFELEG